MPFRRAVTLHLLTGNATQGILGEHFTMTESSSKGLIGPEISTGQSRLAVDAGFEITLAVKPKPRFSCAVSPAYKCSPGYATRWGF